MPEPEEEFTSRFINGSRCQKQQSSQFFSFNRYLVIIGLGMIESTELIYD